MYFRRLSRIRPRTICLNRRWSRSMSINRVLYADPSEYLRVTGFDAQPLFLLRIAAGEDARDVVQNVRGAFVVVAEVADEAALHDVDLLLRLGVDDVRDEAGQLDRILLVLEQL